MKLVPPPPDIEPEKKPYDHASYSHFGYGYWKMPKMRVDWAGVTLIVTILLIWALIIAAIVKLL